MHETIAIIGNGNIAHSLVGGLLTHNYPHTCIWLTGQDVHKLAAAQATWGVHTTTDNTHAAMQAGAVIMAVKPQKMAAVAMELAPTIQQHQPLVLSVAAGVTIASLQHWLGGYSAIVRTMPNTAARLGCSATAAYANNAVSVSQRALADTILQAIGTRVWLTAESQMDAVTALSGSGPAYFFFLMEALQQAGEEMGLPMDIAAALMSQTALGAAQMMAKNTQTPTQLRQQVTSPGGTTEQALAVLDKAGMASAIRQAVFAAKRHAEKLAQIDTRAKP